MKESSEKLPQFKLKYATAVALSLLSGVGWGFGLTATSSSAKENTLEFQLIFTIFAMTHAVVLLTVHGVCCLQARNVWRSFFICCKKHGQYKVPINTSKLEPLPETTTSYPMSNLAEQVNELQTQPKGRNESATTVFVAENDVEVGLDIDQDMNTTTHATTVIENMEKDDVLSNKGVGMPTEKNGTTHEEENKDE